MESITAASKSQKDIGVFYRECIIELLFKIKAEKTLKRIYYFVKRLWIKEG